MGKARWKAAVLRRSTRDRIRVDRCLSRARPRRIGLDRHRARAVVLERQQDVAVRVVGASTRPDAEHDLPGPLAAPALARQGGAEGGRRQERERAASPSQLAQEKGRAA